MADAKDNKDKAKNFEKEYKTEKEEDAPETFIKSQKKSKGQKNR